MQDEEKYAQWLDEHIENWASSLWHGAACPICSGETDGPLVRRYAHPQGGQIKVYASGRLVATNAAGKAKKTSATVEKLAFGHGRWEEVFRYDGH